LTKPLGIYTFTYFGNNTAPFVADANWILRLIAVEINHFSSEELLIGPADSNARYIDNDLVIPCYWL
jgi:hypothetical protein